MYWKILRVESYGWEFCRKKIQAISTDNGGEFTSAEFEAYLMTGVCYQLTLPGIPEQNGIAERMTRIFVETVRSMLVNLNPPLCSFWAEVYLAVTYLRNRS